MAKVVVLANSRREGGRCIAGIDLDTGKWVRPVPSHGTRCIPNHWPVIQLSSPQLLDVFEIPLADALVGDLYQCENRFVQGFNWKRVGRLAAEDLTPYLEDTGIVLHNHFDRVPASYFEKLPADEWKSLQLIRVNADFGRVLDMRGAARWQVLFSDGSGRRLSLRLTDTTFEAFLNDGSEPAGDFILTVSLGEPFSSGVSARYCYKLVAGVIPVGQ